MDVFDSGEVRGKMIMIIEMIVRIKMIMIINRWKGR